MKKVAIIDYGLGNLRSVYNSFEHIGAAPFIAETPQDLDQADCTVLPGVGAFGDGMRILNENGWSDVIRTFALDKKKPFIGICLGMQLLADHGTEDGDHQGLGLMKGDVICLKPTNESIRIPHIGWNDVRPVQDCKTYAGLDKVEDFYFVHSYVFQPFDSSLVSGTCHHGSDFAASVEQGNIWGTQFHPEKSQKAGLALLKNFLKVEQCSKSA